MQTHTHNTQQLKFVLLLLLAKELSKTLDSFISNLLTILKGHKIFKHFNLCFVFVHEEGRDTTSFFLSDRTIRICSKQRQRLQCQGSPVLHMQ